MAMMPELVRSRPLFIDEALARIDVLDLSDPVPVNHRGKTHAMDNDLSRIHRLTIPANRFEPELLTRHLVEVFTICEKLPRRLH